MRSILPAAAIAALALTLLMTQGVSQAGQNSGPTPPAAGTTTPPDGLPEGPGKKVVERMCTGCHSLKTVTAERGTKDDWARTVDLMVSRGAEGSDEDVDAVVKYLAKNFGPPKAGSAPSNAPAPNPQP
jgi:mono/diheme cytochrome c family protein